MTSIEPMRLSPFSADHRNHAHPQLRLPILPSPTASMLPHDPMETAPTASSAPPPMGPPSQQQQPQQLPQPQQGAGPSVTDRNGSGNGTPGGAPGDADQLANGVGGVSAVGAAAAAQQPKVVQTAFIHKLYNMLEDQSIQHLISWSSTNESFVMSPSSEFSKVLSSYFKHTNISSFVRQLNMYGFHKVSDVFHTGAPDSPLWEFKHGNGNFKRGDLVGLREIKRRASRHALIHRDSFSAGPKPTATQQQQPGPPVEPVPDPVEARLGMLEHGMYDVHVRLARAEDNSAFLNSKCQALMEGLLRCHQWNNDLTNHIMTMVPDTDNPVHRDVYNMQKDISRQIEMLRSLEDPQESLPPARGPLFGGLSSEAGPPLSPRQTPHDESRRGSLAGSSRLTPYRGLGPSHLSASPRRYGSISGGSSYSPSASRPPAAQTQLPPPPTAQYPLGPAASPPASLARRHTSADIRVGGWGGHHQQGHTTPQPPSQSSYAPPGHSSGPWPSSPHRTPLGGDQEIRNTLAQYELAPSSGSRRPSPPQDPSSSGVSLAPISSGGSGGSAAGPDAGWQLPGAKYPFRSYDATSGPPTRRSSMASNVHSLLNPAETAERPGDDEEEAAAGGGKRKRVQ